MQKRIDALMFSPRSPRLAPALLLSLVAASAHAGSSVPSGADRSRISVTAVAGDVEVTMAGRAVAVAPSTTVVLPARIVTGQDGNIGLTQAGTNINVANDTDVEIPAEAVDGNLIARLVQHRGNVFYDVAPRDVGKLRVETPFLVAVIKGTQFNVAVQQDSTTISLFEGRLEIRTPDSSDVVQLNAGEIAIRSRVDGAIRVVGMDDETAAAPADDRPAAADAAGTDDIPTADDGAVAKPTVDVAIDGGFLDAGLDAYAGVEGGRDTNLELGDAILDVGLDTGVDVGSASADVGLDTGLDLGGSLDAGLDAGLDLGGLVDTSLDATLDDGSLDVDLDAGLDLGILDVDLDVDLGADTLDPPLDSVDSAPAPRLGGLLGGLL